jgi:hypothetical protein
MNWKLNDRVIVLQGNSEKIGKSVTITKISPNPNSFDNDSFVYFIDGEERYYSYEYYFKLDKEWYREEKLNEILNETNL